jgi:hypothetical protein
MINLGWLTGEQQNVVFTSTQRQVHAIIWEATPQKWMHRQTVGEYVCRHSAGAAQLGKVITQTVTNVHCSGDPGFD